MKALITILLIVVFLGSVPVMGQAIGWLSKRRTSKHTGVNGTGKPSKAESSYASK